MRGRFPALLLLVSLPGGLHAQGGRVGLRIVPRPHQAIRIENGQEMAFQLVLEGLGMDAAKIEGHLRFAGTMRAGAAGRNGSVAAEFLVEEDTLDVRSLDMPVELPNTMSKLKGKTISWVTDARGNITEVRFPDGLGADTLGFQKSLETILTSLPDTSLAVGETVSVPSRIALPFPLPGVTAEPLAVDSRRTFTLTGVRREGRDRIATLDQHLVGRMSYRMPASAQNPSPTGVEMRMTGSGRLEVNLDKGFVSRDSTLSNLDMAFAVPLQSGVTMNIKMTGTIRIETKGAALPK